MRVAGEGNPAARPVGDQCAIVDEETGAVEFQPDPGFECQNRRRSVLVPELHVTPQHVGHAQVAPCHRGHDAVLFVDEHNAVMVIPINVIPGE